MLNRIFWAQVVALGVIFLNLVATQQTKKRNVLILNATGNFLSSMQYILLGAYTGCISCGVAIIRNIVFGLYKDKEIPLYVLIIYWIVAVAIALPFYNGILSLIPIINICIYGFALWQKNMKVYKIIVMYVGAAGAIYDFDSKAYVTLFNEGIDFFGSIIGYIRLVSEEKKTKKENKKDK